MLVSRQLTGLRPALDLNVGGRLMSSLGCLCDPSVKKELAEFVGM